MFKYELVKYSTSLYSVVICLNVSSKLHAIVEAAEFSVCNWFISSTGIGRMSAVPAHGWGASVQYKEGKEVCLSFLPFHSCDLQQQ